MQQKQFTPEMRACLDKHKLLLKQKKNINKPNEKDTDKYTKKTLRLRNNEKGLGGSRNRMQNLQCKTQNGKYERTFEVQETYF